MAQHWPIDKIFITAASTALLEVDNCERHYKAIFAAVCTCSDAHLEIDEKNAPAGTGSLQPAQTRQLFYQKIGDRLCGPSQTVRHACVYDLPPGHCPHREQFYTRIAPVFWICMHHPVGVGID